MSNVESRPEFLHGNHIGTVELICGPMFSGKSDELIRRLRLARYSKLQVQAFKPALDGRRGEETINTFDGIKFRATSVNTSEEILEFLYEGVQVVGVDEVQFFDRKLLEVCEELSDRGIRVIIAGLHSDFRGEPFGPMAELMIDADYVAKLQARCHECGAPASRTQRLRIENGITRPAFYDEPTVVSGGEDRYQARCRHCHDVPHRKESDTITQPQEAAEILCQKENTPDI